MKVLSSQERVRRTIKPYSDFIKYMIAEDVPKNLFAWSHFEGNAPHIKELLERFGLPELKPETLAYYIARHSKHGWDGFLVEHGLNPDEVRIAGYAKLAVLTPEMVRQRQRVAARKTNLTRGGAGTTFGNNDEIELVVIDEATPESLLEKSEVEDLVSDTASTLNQSRKALLDMVLDFLADPLNEFTDLFSDRFSALYLSQTGREISPEQLQDLFSELKENEQLRSMFEN